MSRMMNRLKIYAKWMDGLRDKIKNKWKITLTYDCEYYKNPRLLNRGGVSFLSRKVAPI